MGLILVAICFFAAYRLYHIHPGSILSIIATIITILNFWAWGVMMNYKQDPHNVPEGWVTVSSITTIIGLILLIVSFFISS
jgi:intracellular septation protein A